VLVVFDVVAVVEVAIMQATAAVPASAVVVVDRLRPNSALAASWILSVFFTSLFLFSRLLNSANDPDDGFAVVSSLLVF
jgi:hypothetical protein